MMMVALYLFCSVGSLLCVGISLLDKNNGAVIGWLASTCLSVQLLINSLGA